MRHYLLKTYDAGGRLIGRADYRAATDEEAAGAVPPSAQNRWSELWCGARLVGVWDGAQPIKPPRPAAPRKTDPAQWPFGRVVPATAPSGPV